MKFYKILSKYLDKKYFGDKRPLSLTGEEIYKSDLWKKENHPFIFKMKNSILSIEVFFERYFIDKIKFPLIFYKNAIRDKTHIIETGLKKGYWYDTTTILKEGIFKQIIFFVEHEAKDEISYYKENKNTDVFDEYPEHQIKTYKTVLDAYDWYTIRKPKLQKEIDHLYDIMSNLTNKELESNNISKDLELSYFFKKLGKYSMQEKEINLQIRELESSIDNEMKDHLHNIINVIDSLWS